MGDKNLTLFALHTHGDTQFGPSSAPDVGSEDTPSPKEAASKAKSLFNKGKRMRASEDDETEIDVSESDDESGRGNIGMFLVGLFFLAAIAMVAKKVGGGKQTEVDLTESDDL